MVIVLILNILFKIDIKFYEYIFMDIYNLDKDVFINNVYYFVSNFVVINGVFYIFVMMGGIFIFMIMLKIVGYFVFVVVMVFLCIGIVWDICIQVYNKVLSFFLSFFLEECKGDIIVCMSVDVMVVENLLISFIDMFICNFIVFLVCFVILFLVSW